MWPSNDVPVEIVQRPPGGQFPPGHQCWVTWYDLKINNLLSTKLYKCILIENDTAIWATYSQYFHPYWETVFCSFLGLRQKQTEWFQRSLYTTVRRLFLGDLILIEWPKGLKAVLYCTFYKCIPFMIRSHKEKSGTWPWTTRTNTVTLVKIDYNTIFNLEDFRPF